MHLFDVLPQNLFSILASKNKHIYADALFVLRKAFRQEMTIKKEDLISMLISNLDEKMLSIDMEEMENTEEPSTESSNGSNENNISLSTIAHFILRRLKETGWIDVEYQDDSFEEVVTLPDYSIKLINLLFSFTDENLKEYNSYVFSTYSALKTAHEEEEDSSSYNALFTAYENTVRLVDELKSLHNNIRRYHQALSDLATVNEVLKGHFDEYKTLVSDRIYHPLKTFDSIPRYKAPILRLLQRWLTDSSLRQRTVEQAVMRGRYKTREEGHEDILSKIGYIMDTYERLDNILEEIDRKNTAYTRASVEKMRYLLNTDRSIKGKIVEILKRVADSPQQKQETLIARLQEAVELFHQRYIDENSLYVRAARHKKLESTPLQLPPSQDEDEEEIMKEFLDKAKKSYNHTRVMAFMRNVMKDFDVVYSHEIPLPDDESFILLMLATLKGHDRKMFYRVEFMDGYVYNNGYRIPNMRFIRKDRANVG
ncbi:hypothetical protein JOD02_002088 [Caldicoprobacter guelmensis]|uniref:Wadjet anti-phage system protein JetA family protein n=1 Tax=Caldicoprobacter guelmensis TaxID=1170224 RepID=UPI001957CD23|nr:Wadjet anti-phage system protein JetA family protein [Caldicoprobacter guelmensis]MBM7583210.1 hypothetical protein [Caldicoprobacter guelmensis]